MACKLRHIYDSSVNLDDVYDELIVDMDSNYISEAVVNCRRLKEKGYPTPIGFSIMEYDEYDLNDGVKTSNYYFNGTIIKRSNAPADWDKKVFEHVKQFIYINENFCIPYNDQTDKILKTNL